jgi:hypothetical protein
VGDPKPDHSRTIINGEGASSLPEKKQLEDRTMNISPILLVLLIAVSALYIAIRGLRIRKADQTRQAHRLGFEELASCPANLLDRAENLYQGGENRGVTIRRVFSRQEPGKQFFIFDASSSRGDSSPIGSEIFGVISSQLTLPRFSLTTLPTLGPNSFFSDMVENLMDQVLTHAEGYLGMKSIDLPAGSDLSSRVILLGENQGAVQALLDRTNLRFLLRNPNPIHIAGSGDFLTVDFSMNSSLNTSKSDLQTQYRLFLEVFNTFQI